MAKKDFKNIIIRRFNLKTPNSKLYYIYKSEDDVVEIEADSAQLALAKSEIKDPYKIIPASSINKIFLSEEELTPQKNSEENQKDDGDETKKASTEEQQAKSEDNEEENKAQNEDKPKTSQDAADNND